MENIKTISDLKNKIWYRFFKVVFIAAFFIVLIAGNLMFIRASMDYHGLNNETSLYNRYLIETGKVGANFNFLTFIKFFFIGNFIILLIFEAIRRVFYYIVLGSIKPKR